MRKLRFVVVALAVCSVIFGYPLYPVARSQTEIKPLNEIIDIIPLSAKLTTETFTDAQSPVYFLDDGWQQLLVNVAFINKTSSIINWDYDVAWGRNAELSDNMMVITPEGYEYRASGFYPKDLDIVADVLPPGFIFYEYDKDSMWEDTSFFMQPIIVFIVPKAFDTFSFLYYGREYDLSGMLNGEIGELDFSKVIGDYTRDFNFTSKNTILAFGKKGEMRINSFSHTGEEFNLSVTAQNVGGENEKFESDTFEFVVIDNMGRLFDLRNEGLGWSSDIISPMGSFDYAFSIRLPEGYRDEPKFLCIFQRKGYVEPMIGFYYNLADMGSSSQVNLQTPPSKTVIEAVKAALASAAPAAEPVVLTGEAKGFAGHVTVTVTVQDGKIVEVKAAGPDETEGIGTPALTEVPARIVAANSPDVDVLAGATWTSKGVIEAVKAALASAAPATEPVVLTGEAKGFMGPVTVTVTVEGDKILEVTAAGPDETDGIGTLALTDVPARIVAANSADVDVLAGATLTSKAVIEAVKAALTGIQPQ